MHTSCEKICENTVKSFNKVKALKKRSEFSHAKRLRPEARRCIRRFNSGAVGDNEKSFAALFFKMVESSANVELLWDIAEIPEWGEKGNIGKEMLAYAKTIASFKKLLESHTEFKPDLLLLSRFPPGTLGFEYANFMQNNGLDPEFFPLYAENCEQSWYLNWLRKTHDVMHLVSDYASHLGEEMGWQAFYAANAKGQLGSAFVSMAVLHLSKHYPQRVGEHLLLVAEAHSRGEAALPLFAVDWNTLWEVPLVEVRTMLKIAPRKCPHSNIP